MKESGSTLFTRRTTVVNLILTAIFFVVFTWLLRPFVPSTNPMAIILVAAFTSLCLTGVFFLASFMFAAVLNDQRNPHRRNS